MNRQSQLQIFVMAAALIGACAASHGQRTSPASEESGKLPQYENVADKAGINFRHSFGEQHLSTIMESTGSGCAWFDYNNDGLLDLYVLSGRHIDGVTDHSDPDGVRATNHLYRNNGGGTFTDVTSQAGVAGKGFGMGVTVGDYDNDGYEDIYVTNWNSAILYHNNGNGTFTDVTERAGVQNHHFGAGAAFLDYDRDGRLDLFIGNYLKFDPNAREPFYSAEAFPGPLDYEPDNSRLFHNNGDGTFTDVSQRSGIASVSGRAMGVALGDFDNDGWPDIYVANDQMASFLFHNNHDGTFANVATEMNVAFGENGESPVSMGPIFADFENGGWLDIFVSDMRYHRLYRNAGKQGYFTDATVQSGVAQVSGQYVAWGDGVFDFNNDGWKDIFIVDGGLNWAIPMEDVLLRNNGNGTFTDVSTQAGSYFDTKKVGRGACFADYDNDGYVDGFIVALGGKGILLHAQPPASEPNHWLTLRLVGTKSNRDGFGARIEAAAGDLRQTLENVPQSGYLSQNDPRPHFGLGRHTEVDTITVRWPSGLLQTLRNVKADQILTVTEPAAGSSALAAASEGKAR
jgi:enediyne biosynthesis protein E4